MVAAFSNLQKAHGKPFIFTEVGYRSGDGTNKAPWDWGLSMAADPAEQADCYAALFDVWSRETSWMKGPVLVGVGRQRARRGRHRLQPARQAGRGRAEAVAEMTCHPEGERPRRRPRDPPAGLRIPRRVAGRSSSE